MAERHDFHIYEGETFEHTFPTITDSGGNAIDLTAGTYSAKVILRDHPFDTNQIDQWNSGSEMTLQSDGTIDLKLPSSRTKGYDFSEVVYDLQLTYPNGDIKYPYEGHITLDHAVTTS